jgi:DNA-binding CsgD family transcriptional regulator
MSIVSSEVAAKRATLDVPRPNSASEEGERERAVLFAVLNSLTAWDSFAGGSRRLLRELACALGQTAGAFWLPEGNRLILRATWSREDAESERLDWALGEAGARRGAGLAGRAWELREAVDWASRGHGERIWRRAPAGRLAATVALPCLRGEEVLGVLELYSPSAEEWSDHLLQVLTYAGDALGVFLARRRAELGLSPLTRRELEVLMLAAEGLSVREIAQGLAIAGATVKTHLEHIYAKLGVGDRSAAVACALRAGYFE